MLLQRHCVDEIMNAACLSLNSLKEKSPGLIQPWMPLHRGIPNRLLRSVDLRLVSSPAPEPCGIRQPVFHRLALRRASCASVFTGSPPYPKGDSSKPSVCLATCTPWNLSAKA